MTDREIMEHLKWLYAERKLCKWCRHPNKKVASRGLCSPCYRLALDFRKKPSPALGNAINFAMHEGTINALEWPITGLEVEQLFERVARMVFSWRKATDNPFWHSANTWGESFSEQQCRLLFHHFSMVEREALRKTRRVRAEWLAMIKMKPPEIRQVMKKAIKAVKEVFGL